MGSATGLGTHLHNGKAWRIVDIDWEFGKFAHGFGNLREVFPAKVASFKLEGIDTGSVGKHTVD